MPASRNKILLRKARPANLWARVSPRRLHQRQRMPGAAPRRGQPRPASVSLGPPRPAASGLVGRGWMA
eukprot:scaffold71473_cov45-Phaeocystis_antarctica.AAC.1